VWLYRKRERAADMVTASEIAAFVYCPEAWRLEHGLGLEARNWAARDAGTRHHEETAAAERMVGAFTGIGRILIIAAVLILVLLWLAWR
jgi:hypothetical protein